MDAGVALGQVVVVDAGASNFEVSKPTLTSLSLLAMPPSSAANVAVMSLPSS